VAVYLTGLIVATGWVLVLRRGVLGVAVPPGCLPPQQDQPGSQVGWPPDATALLAHLSRAAVPCLCQRLPMNSANRPPVGPGFTARSYLARDALIFIYVE